jgi:hypothetical protein
VPILIGVQNTDIRDTIELCQLGDDVGVDAVQISGPYYYDGRWDDVVVSAFLATGGRRRQLTVAGDAVTPDSRDGLRALLGEVAAMEFSPAVPARQ